MHRGNILTLLTTGIGKDAVICKLKVLIYINTFNTLNVLGWKYKMISGRFKRENA